MGNGASIVPHEHRARVNGTVPANLPVWRRDGRDIKIMKNIIDKELKNLCRANPEMREEQIVNYMEVFSRGLWESYIGMVDLILDEQMPYNERKDADPDHWFEIDFANTVLFANLNLKGIEELLPGRLFTTRMPRDIKTNPENAERFQKRVDKKHLHSVLILTEKQEYEKYAGSDLEEFYRSLGLNVISRPIKDFTIPKPDDLIQDIKDVTWLLSEGHNVLIHCAGGSGRTGLVVAGIVRNVGVRDPISWIRRVKSVYVETQAQEEFITHLPVVIDERIAQRHPKLLEAMVLEQLLDMSSPGLSLDTQKQVALSESQLQDINTAFDRLDKDHKGVLSIEYLTKLINELGGATVDVEKAMTRIDLKKDGEISKDEFQQMMSYTMKSSVRHYPDSHPHQPASQLQSQSQPQ